ncbi:MAG: CusA/CzcA family heavy metal efflux RND transporter [Acidobacteriota bacterium]
MLARLFEFSLRNRALTLVFAALLVGIGVYSLGKLPIDAVPDVTPNQVQILTTAPALSPLEIEKFVTFPVEAAMSGLPGLKQIRSISRFGLSAVTLYFDEGQDIYFCRQLVLERLPQAKEAIPAGFGNPTMGPISTGLGEIYQFEVRGPGMNLMELRSILEWDIAPRLKSVPGVVEINTFGGELKTYQVQLEPARLAQYGVSLEQLFETLEKNNSNSGGGYIVHNQEQILIRGEGLVEKIDQIGDIVVKTSASGTPVFVRNLGAVALAPAIRQGAVTRDGRGEAVTGIVMMLIGGNSREVSRAVDQRIQEVGKTLPAGVQIETYYNRTQLVNKTIKTVVKNLAEGAVLVIVVLLLLLGNVRGGLIVASAIPLSMLIAFTGMVGVGISGNLMSLGAIDFGLIVDGSVLMIENIVRKLAEKHNPGQSRMETIFEAGREVVRPIFFAVAIIIIVYLPILSLTGVEGKMFRPMAITVIFALVASLLLSLTLMPVLASFFLKQAEEKETRVIRWIKDRYQPLLEKAIARPKVTAAFAGGFFLLAAALGPMLGAEFIPRLDEGSLAIQAWRLPSVSLEDSLRSTKAIETALKKFPEVVTVVSKTGRAEIATDPMGVETSDILVMLKPQEEWKSAKTKAELIDRIDKALDKVAPGNAISYSQPIELRVQELIAGVRSDVAILLFGQDLEILKSKAEEIARVVGRVSGAADTKAEQIAGLPMLRVTVDRLKLARYGVKAEEVLDAVAAVGGRTVGQVLEGSRRFDLQVRIHAADRDDVNKIGNIAVADPQGRLIPIAQLATIRREDGPNQIGRENLQRRIAIEANVRGRDLAGFVADAQRAVAKNVTLPPGYRLEWGGQFENFQRASRRLTLVVPLALSLILLLLFMMFNTLRPALLIFLNVPVAATGGIIALLLRGMPFSISAGVGFIALAGVAVMNGVVLVSYIIDQQKLGLSAAEAALRGGLDRMRAMIMAPLVAALGFVPMAFASSAGAEVQRPLATVVIGGLLPATLLTLLVIPALYRWFAPPIAVREL